VKLTTHLLLVSRSRMRGDILSLHQYFKYQYCNTFNSIKINSLDIDTVCELAYPLKSDLLMTSPCNTTCTSQSAPSLRTPLISYCHNFLFRISSQMISVLILNNNTTKPINLTQRSQLNPHTGKICSSNSVGDKFYELSLNMALKFTSRASLHVILAAVNVTCSRKVFHLNLGPKPGDSEYNRGFSQTL
jgi:hypothetical protein